MKRKIRFIFCWLLIICLCCVSLASCGSSGASAYDIAVKNGFVGTEKEWLASLKGQDLNIYEIYTQAQNEGYTGDFLSFLTDHLGLDSDMVADAILNYEGNDVSKAVAHPLLASVSIQCSSSGTSGDVKPASGSGVILSLDKNAGDAYIITNQHVVAYTGNNSQRQIHQSISVFLWGAELVSSNIIRATYIGGSDTYDVAVLKITGSSLLTNSHALPISYANSDLLVMGQTVIAVGNAAGQGISVTTGALSMDSKMVTLGGNREQRLLQIEAPVNEGNSGGGLFDEDGNLIGIVSSKVESSSVENMGYAIPSNIAIGVAENIVEAYKAAGQGSNVSLKVADLGITLEKGNTWGAYDDEAGVARIYETVTVDSVSLSSPARQAGLKSGDVITKITVDGKEIDVLRSHSLIDAQLLMREGSKVTITYTRKGETSVVQMTLSSSAFQVIS